MLESMLLNRTGLYESSFDMGEIDPEIDAINLDTVDECEGNPFEYAVQAMYENELNFARISQATMLTEFAYLYENGTVIEESAEDAGKAVGDFFKKIGDGIKKLWEKICAFFKSIFATIGSWIKTDKAFVKKYAEKAKKMKTVTLDSKYNVKEYKTSNTTIMNTAEKVFDSLREVGDDYTSAANNGNDDNDKYSKSDTIKVYADKCGYTGVTDIDGFVKAFKKEIFGGDEETKTATKVFVSYALAEIEKADITKKAVQAQYTMTKKYFSYLKATCKALEGASKKMSKTDNLVGVPAMDTAKKAAAHQKVNYHEAAKAITTGSSLASKINSVACKYITKMNRQNKKLVLAAVKTYDAKDSKNESASMFDEFELI